MTKLLNAREIAGIVGLKPGTLYRGAKNGTIPSIRIGRAIRFDPAAILKPIQHTLTREEVLK